ncbi:MAG TPA: cupin domain-containing protein [Anaerolineales bacterium]|nr:cupin domain-containing protein [Anaerolineales bacterium]
MSRDKLLVGQDGKDVIQKFRRRNTVKGLHHRDLREMDLHYWEDRGGNSLWFDTDTKAMEAHISEIPPGEHKRAHRHFHEALIYIVRGKGYSLIWGEGEEPRKYEWSEGDLISIPVWYWHQHFNTDLREPVRYLAITNINHMDALGFFRHEELPWKE